MSYANKTAEQLLLERVNEVNEGVFTLADLNFGNPIVTDEFERNTKFLITPGPRFTPEPGVEYFVWVNRLDATELFSRYNVTELEVPNVATTVEAARWIAQTYGLPIIDSDIVDAPIADDQFVLEFSVTSKVIFGTLNCRRTAAPLFLGDLLTVTILQGFDYPDAIVDHLVLPVVAPNAQMGAHATKVDGTLQAGTGVPAQGMTVATNNELELAISASYWKGQPQAFIEPVDGVYSPVLTQTQEWNFIFSVAGFNIEDPITDLYDIVLYVKSIDSGDRIEFTLTREEDASYHWVNLDLGLDITDSSVNGDVIQNIQRLSFYASQFANTTRNGGTPNAFLGTFELGLVGYRKNSLVPRVAAIASVVATAAQV